MARTRRARDRVTVARVWGVDVQVHWSFLALLVVVAWATAGGGVAHVVAAVVWIVAVFASVLVHELAHCVVARRHGAVVEDILLIPLGGISQVQKMPEGPADEFPIAVVGPLASFGLALATGVVGVIVGARLWPPTLFAGSWFARLAWLNVLLGAFNLLPALPMDGGRVLRASLARHRGHREATRLAARVARYLGVAMVAVGFLYDLWLVLIGVFVLLGSGAEARAAEDGGRDEGAPPHLTTPPRPPERRPP